MSNSQSAKGGEYAINWFTPHINFIHAEGLKRKSSNWHFSSNPHFYIFVNTILSYISLLNIKTQFCKKMYKTKICPNALCATLSFCWKRKSSMCNAKIKNKKIYFSPKPHNLKFSYLVYRIVSRCPYIILEIMLQGLNMIKL